MAKLSLRSRNVSVFAFLLFISHLLHLNIWWIFILNSLVTTRCILMKVKRLSLSLSYNNCSFHYLGKGTGVDHKINKRKCQRVFLLNVNEISVVPNLWFFAEGKIIGWFYYSIFFFCIIRTFSIYVLRRNYVKINFTVIKRRSRSNEVQRLTFLQTASKCNWNNWIGRFFHFFNSLIQNPGLISLVKREWKCYRGNIGMPFFIFTRLWYYHIKKHPETSFKIKHKSRPIRIRWQNIFNFDAGMSTISRYMYKSERTNDFYNKM